MSLWLSSVPGPRIKHIQRKREDRIEELVEQDPCRHNSCHAERGIPDEFQESEGGFLAHQNGDAGASVERRNRQQIKCAQQ